MAKKWTQITNLQTGEKTTIIGGGGSPEVISSLEAGKTVSQVVEEQVVKGATIRTSEQAQVKALTWKAEQQRKGKFGGEEKLPETLAKLEKLGGEPVTEKLSVKAKEIPEPRPAPPIGVLKVGEAVPKPSPYYVKLAEYIKKAGGIAWGERLPPDSRRMYRTAMITGGVSFGIGAVTPLMFPAVKGLLYVAGGIGAIGVIKEAYKEPKRIPELVGYGLIAVAGYGIARTTITPYLKPKVAGVKVRALTKEQLRLGEKRLYEVYAKPKVGIKYPLRKITWKEVEVRGFVGVEPTIKPRYARAVGRYVPKYKGKLLPTVTYKGIVKTITPTRYAEIGITYPPKAVLAEAGFRLVKYKGREIWAGAGEIYLKSLKRGIPSETILFAKRLEAPPTEFITGLTLKKVTVAMKPVVAKQIMLDIGKTAIEAVKIKPLKGMPIVPVAFEPIPVTKVKRVPVTAPVTITAVRERVITMPKVAVREIAGVITKRRAMVTTITAVSFREALITRPALAIAVTPKVAVKEKLALRLAYAYPTPAVPVTPAIPKLPIVPIGIPSFRFGFDVGWLRKRRVPARRVTAYVPAYPALVFRVYGRPARPPIRRRYYTGFEMRPIPYGFTFANLFKQIKWW